MKYNKNCGVPRLREWDAKIWLYQLCYLYENKPTEHKRKECLTPPIHSQHLYCLLSAASIAVGQNL